MTVIILHGLGRTAASMRYLAIRLEKAGFETIRINYPSTKARIPELVELLTPMLPETGRVDFVGHSLGGILAKHLMRRIPEHRRGRIVQLGSPNLGSEIAVRAGVLDPLFGPALAELEPHEGMDDSDLDIGAIAGDSAWSAYGLLTGIEGPNDGKVSVRSAHASARPANRLTISAAHSTIMLKSDAIAATIRFLSHGDFGSG